MKVILVSHFLPSVVGHGGIHRTYQIHYDIQQTVGPNNVEFLQFMPRKTQQPSTLSRNLANKKKELQHRVQNPFRLLSRTTFSPHAFEQSHFTAAYYDLVKQFQPDVCVLEHPAFSKIIEYNRLRQIPTIMCTHNLESLDASAPGPPKDRWHIRLGNQKQWHLYARTYDLATELGILAECDYRLLISKVETALVHGIGIPADYYPYRPVGGIKDRLLQIREERQRKPQENGLFLLLGSAQHETTKEAFYWLLQQIEQNGLPGGIRIVLIGSDTDKLFPAGKHISGLEIYGWLEQAQFDQLLIKTQGILAPHNRGFGTLTRLSEMSCAGIPVITSQFATYALDLPPDIWPVESIWEGWLKQMQALMDRQQPAGMAAYETWHHQQTPTLQNVLQSMLA